VSISNKINAAQVLRLYVWEMLSANEVLEKVSVRGEMSIPIIPFSDEPDLRDSGKPYIIYGWSESEDNSSREIERGTVAFRVIAPDFNKLTNITNILSSGMKGEDDVATNVNEWTDQALNGTLQGLRFTWVHTTMTNEAEPSDSEGGEVENTVIVGYKYVPWNVENVKVFRQGTWK
jgi:hypothetical protein